MVSAMSDATTKSARRVFEIMEYFDEVRIPLSLKAVCDRLGYPSSSGQAMLKSLVLLGYLEYDRRSQTYLPTMRIAVLGSWVSEQLFGGINVLKLMDYLREETRETVILGAQSDLYAQYVHVLHSLEPLHYAIPPGTLRPLARCGIGRLLLSSQAEADVDRIVRRINIADPDNRVDLGELTESFEAIRREGHVFSRHIFNEGVGILAVLLPQAPFERTFAIGLGGPVDRLEANHARNLAVLRAATSDFAPTHQEP